MSALPKGRKLFRTTRHLLPRAHPLMTVSLLVNDTSTNSTIASPPKVVFRAVRIRLSGELSTQPQSE
jgi:hypothetical protein